ncbi:hypothetical protein GIB67_040340 [Kingdonia uniflora]|uniref:Uncharacterized protein n=1 Tax=Kingdonia uniflora TaxID=39325 RepID=A0A7J7L9B5_9MAGN|nr:hypothetical protein GIB67_040340 [Kingdonia uniflora]
MSTIGRIYYTSQNSGEKYYLWLLLTVVKGLTSFQSLRIVNNVVYKTFKLECAAMGLLEDDKEWIYYFDEFVAMHTGYQLRMLFCIILAECNPIDPQQLWNRLVLG